MAVLTPLGFFKDTNTPGQVVYLFAETPNVAFGEAYEDMLPYEDSVLQAYVQADLSSFMDNPIYGTGGGGGTNNRPVSGLIYPRGVN
jgi:hypothetical protein